MEFVDCVRIVLMTEHHRTEESADDLIERFPNIIRKAMRLRRGNYRACAIALERADILDEDASPSPDVPVKV